MTRNELWQILISPDVMRLARRFPWERIRDTYLEGLMARWAGMNINAWLQQWHGHQSFMLRRLWLFSEDNEIAADFDLMVAYERRVRLHKVRILLERGTPGIRIIIVRWVNGQQKEVWNSYGILSVSEGESADYYCIETLPIPGRDRLRRGRANLPRPQYFGRG